MAVSVNRPQQSDYAELKQRVKAAGLLDRQPRFYVPKITAALTMLAIGLALIFLVHAIWFQILNAIFLAIVFTQVAFLAHDGGHKAIFRPGGWGDAFCILDMNLLLGGSAGWWIGKHNAHHTNPNHVDLDPDFAIPVFAFSEEQARSKGGLMRWILRYQAYYFFPLLTLEYYSLRLSSFRYLLTKRSRYRFIEAPAMILHYPLYFGLVFWQLGFGLGLVFLLIQQGLTGLYIGITFAPNHKGMPVLDDSTDMDFVRRQIVTARNLRKGRISDYVFGPLASQIEHHLFPSMPTNNGRKAELVVKDFCNERSISYYEVGVVQAFREILGHLQAVSSSLRTSH
ncbi:MAG: fatty acid desaturase [Chloroflexota bacterium]